MVCHSKSYDQSDGSDIGSVDHRRLVAKVAYVAAVERNLHPHEFPEELHRKPPWGIRGRVTTYIQTYSGHSPSERPMDTYPVSAVGRGIPPNFTGRNCHG